MLRTGLTATALIAGAALVATLLSWHEHHHTVHPLSRLVRPARLSKLPRRREDRSTMSGVRDPVGRTATKTDWKALFDASHDYFAFVRRAAGPAHRGDGSAALYIAKALFRCELEVWTYKTRKSENSGQRARDESWKSRYPLLAERMRTQYRRHYALCKGFFRHDAFAALPPRKGGYFSALYWLNQAYRDHNPVAEIEHVAVELPAPINPPTVLDGQEYAEIRETLRHAVATGNPEAVFRAGMLLARGTRAEVIRGLAVALAGCELGYDCSSTNASLFHGCARTGICPPGEDFSDIVRKSVGDAGYAQAFAMARQLVFAISRGDAATVAQFVDVPPSFRCASIDKPPVRCAPIPAPSPGGPAQ